MSKYTPPAPSLADIMAYLSDDLGASLAVRCTVYPTRDPFRAMASVEVVYTHLAGFTTIVRREGEVISTRSPGQLAGAWFRAAVRLSSYFDGKDADEVLALHLYKGGWKR